MAKVQRDNNINCSRLVKREGVVPEGLIKIVPQRNNNEKKNKKRQQSQGQHSCQGDHDDEPCRVVTTIEYDFWHTFFGLLSQSLQSAFVARVRSNINGLIDWDFWCDKSYKSALDGVICVSKIDHLMSQEERGNLSMLADQVIRCRYGELRRSSGKYQTHRHICNQWIRVRKSYDYANLPKLGSSSSVWIHREEARGRSISRRASDFFSMYKIAVLGGLTIFMVGGILTRLSRFR